MKIKFIEFIQRYNQHIFILLKKVQPHCRPAVHLQLVKIKHAYFSVINI
jgi:hypothetical protein